VLAKNSNDDKGIDNMMRVIEFLLGERDHRRNFLNICLREVDVTMM
jgi:hypothetical protein